MTTMITTTKPHHHHKQTSPPTPVTNSSNSANSNNKVKNILRKLILFTKCILLTLLVQHSKASEIINYHTQHSKTPTAFKKKKKIFFFFFLFLSFFIDQLKLLYDSGVKHNTKQTEKEKKKHERIKESFQ